MKQMRRVDFCPHCGNRSPHTLVHQQNCSDLAWTVDDGEELEIDVTYFVVICEACNKVLVYGFFQCDTEEHTFLNAKLLFPSSGELHKSVPDAVASIYNEAVRIKRLAPNAFAVQIRRALEALCEDRGANQKTLQERLKHLADKGEIPRTLAEVTDVLRFIGNLGAHASKEAVKSWQVDTIDDFFRAVVEYVYVAPSKVEEFRNKLAAFKAKAVAEE